MEREQHNQMTPHDYDRVFDLMLRIVFGIFLSFFYKSTEATFAKTIFQKDAKSTIQTLVYT